MLGTEARGARRRGGGPVEECCLMLWICCRTVNNNCHRDQAWQAREGWVPGPCPRTQPQHASPAHLGPPDKRRHDNLGVGLWPQLIGHLLPTSNQGWWDDAARHSGGRGLSMTSRPHLQDSPLFSYSSFCLHCPAPVLGRQRGLSHGSYVARDGTQSGFTRLQTELSQGLRG